MPKPRINGPRSFELIKPTFSKWQHEKCSQEGFKSGKRQRTVVAEVIKFEVILQLLSLLVCERWHFVWKARQLWIGDTMARPWKLLLFVVDWWSCWKCVEQVDSRWVFVRDRVFVTVTLIGQGTDEHDSLDSEKWNDGQTSEKVQIQNLDRTQIHWLSHIFLVCRPQQRLQH